MVTIIILSIGIWYVSWNDIYDPMNDPSYDPMNDPSYNPTVKISGNTSPEESPNTNTSTESYKWQWMDLSCFWNWGGKCGINVYTILWIKKSNPNVEVKTFVQDIVLSATMFFGTVLSIVIFFSGLIYIFSAIKWAESLQSKAKKWIIGWIIGLLLVSGSFAIVRFIQFLAQGGG